MFRTLRWRLTLWFMLLSLLVYTGLSALGIALFHTGLTSALDDELLQLTQELLPNIDYEQNGNDLQLRVWPTNGKVHNPIKLLAAVQIFDKHKKFVQEYGPPGDGHFLPGVEEISAREYSKRSMNTPIYSGDGSVVGYLQIQLTTKLRKKATAQFGWTMASIAPLMILALGLSGYFFAGKATKPIEDTFVVLRQFLSDAGHELGTPIAIIQAANENLQEQLQDTPHTARLNIIGRSTDRMSKLVQDLTLLARMDVRTEPQQNTVISLDRVAKSCIEEFEDLFREKQVTLVSSEIQPANIVGDADSLHRMLANLMDNALRYTNTGGEVVVSLKATTRGVKLSVDDTGAGIPAESIPHLFDRFYRVDKSRSRGAGGSGLGLAIVKAIVDQHRATIEVASEPEKGSRFSVIFSS